MGILLVNTDNSDVSTLTSTLNGFDLSSSPDPSSEVQPPTMIGNFEVLGLYSADSSGNYDGSADLFILDDGISANDNLVFLWFPSIESLSGTITAGQQFGILTGMPASEDLSGESQAFVVPAEGSTANMIFVDNGATNGGLTDQSQFVASYATVPEPSSFALIGLGALATLFRRRR
ncbi:PEP-CTERM sorting domain-containing protein [Rubritalea halochordaticola]|uniref:PEP-CTERM sorting domain-containing protein n=1 Tax=Rubritalea halochordaticola TaxID=714537 RepID=UPI0031FBED90